MAAEQEQQFTLAEITEALDSLDTDAQQTVLGALSRLAEKRQAEQKEQTLHHSIVRFAAIYHRANADNASGSNIESWTYDMGAAAEELLELFTERTELSELEALARETAGLTYTYMCLEDHDTSVLHPLLLAGAGIDVGSILKTYKEGAVAVLVSKGTDETDAAATVEERYRDLSDFSYNLDSDHWERIVEPRAKALRAKLIEAGFALPELNTEGKYGEDDDLDILIQVD